MILVKGDACDQAQSFAESLCPLVKVTASLEEQKSPLMILVLFYTLENAKI